MYEIIFKRIQWNLLRLANLNGMPANLRLEENFENRRLTTWLTEEEYDRFVSDRES